METVFLTNNNRVTNGKVIILGEDVPTILKRACTTHRDTEIVIRAMIDSGSLTDVIEAVASCALRDGFPAVDLLYKAAQKGR